MERLQGSVPRRGTSWLPLLLLALLQQLPVSVRALSRQRKVTVNYPVRWQGTLSDNHITGNASANVLTCFGNEEFAPPSYTQGFICMFHAYVPYFEYDCHSIWGSRSVIVESVGSVEYFKLTKLPRTIDGQEPITMKVSRWLDHPTLYQNVETREARQIPAEPIYLCARSTIWERIPDAHHLQQQSKFSIHFRSGHIREIDKRQCKQNLVLHVVLLIALSNVWLLPYIISPVVAVYVYLHGLKIFILCSCVSGFVLCLAPIMLKAKNRHLAGHYLAYFLPGVKEEATIHVIRRRLPVFQAVFFSSAAVCIGSAGAYVSYAYFGIDREHRNIITKLTLGFAASWLVFFFCRSFERFLRDWLWVGMSIGLAQILYNHLNPLCHDELSVAAIAVSFLAKALINRLAESGADMRDTVDFLTSSNIEEYNQRKRLHDEKDEGNDQGINKLWIRTVESVEEEFDGSVHQDGDRELKTISHTSFT
jgi:hypothetical protein